MGDGIGDMSGIKGRRVRRTEGIVVGPSTAGSMCRSYQDTCEEGKDN